MLYKFSNRRRAKDAILTLINQHPAQINSVSVYVQEEMVYIDVDAQMDDLPAIMNFGELIPPDKDTFQLDLITELYAGDGIRRFRM